MDPHSQALGEQGLPPEVRETALRAIVEANFAVCYDWNLRTGECTFWGRFDQLLGFPAEESPRTIDEWLKLVHPEDIDRVIEKNRQSIEGLLPYRDEYRMVHRNGETVIVTDSGQVIAASGKATLMVGGIRDVTREREAQRALEESNTALRVILRQRDQDRLDLERDIRNNVAHLVLPALNRITHSLGNHPQAAQLLALRQTLEEIVRPFASELTSAGGLDTDFSQREIEIVDLIRRGWTTDEIAELLFLSPATVSYHRKSIRRKLGIPKGGRRLASHLASLKESDAEAESDADVISRRFEHLESLRSSRL